MAPRGMPRKGVCSARHYGLRTRFAAARQRGVAALEFALIFPTFFLIFYAIVTYGLIFAAQQTLTLAASEGARAAVRYQQSPAARLATSCATAVLPLEWLQRSGGIPAGTACSGSATLGVNARNITGSGAACPAGVTCVEVVVSYDYANFPLVPRLLGRLLSLPTPATLRGRAVAQYSTTT